MRKIDPDLHHRRRLQILEAAAICFIRRGFHQSSMQEICSQAKMSPGALYRYFESKSQIIEAIAEEDRSETKHFLDEIQQHDSFIEGFMQAVKSRITQSLKEDYARLAVEVLAEVTRNPKIAKRFIANDKQMKTSLVQMLKTAIKNGTVNPTIKPDAVAELLIATIEGIEGRAILNPNFKFRSVAPALEEMISQFLRPDRPA
ncbi:MAG: TetR/AcrR family transcriptional regulator [Nitrospirae bacterium]|nr:TetR/AcrR family transcriptional regulator [Candidatus Manganitrophaceae bacterium]